MGQCGGGGGGGWRGEGPTIIISYPSPFKRPYRKRRPPLFLDFFLYVSIYLFSITSIIVCHRFFGFLL